MSFLSEIGDIVIREVCVEWEIPGFFSLSNKVNDDYKSPVFNFDESQWYLSLYPNGQAEKSPGWVSLFLHRCDTYSPAKIVYCTFGIKDSDGVEEKAEAKFDLLVSKPNRGYGYPKCWSRSELIHRKSTLLPKNVLTVTCRLRSNAHRAIKGEEQLRKSLRNMLENGDDSDVVIKVRGKEFPAHRNILRARSTVFRSMFTHDMVEKQSGVVKIEDGDPGSFQDFLIHMYSGSCEQISTKNVYSMYTAADKYDVGELKEACTKFIKRNITVSGFCDVMEFAKKHDDEELVECATNFFCDNSVDIVKTTEWLNFQRENLTVGNELFVKAMSIKN